MTPPPIITMLSFIQRPALSICSFISIYRLHNHCLPMHSASSQFDQIGKRVYPLQSPFSSLAPSQPGPSLSLLEHSSVHRILQAPLPVLHHSQNQDPHQR